MFKRIFLSNQNLDGLGEFMKKVFVRNLIIVLTLMVLSLPYNFFVRHYAIEYNPFQFVAVIIYALLCGASLVLMDLSNRRINIIFAALYLLVSIVDLQFSILFAYGPTDYFYVLGQMGTGTNGDVPFLSAFLCSFCTSIV